MGRKAIETKLPEKPVIDHEAVTVELEAARTQLVAATQHDSMVRAVAAQLGYQLPADCTDPDLIQRDIAANMRRSVEACLEVGRGLAVLKTSCGHGNFMARLDVLGIDRFVAAKFTQAATKFSNVSSTTHLTKAIGNQTKLFEMLVLDDEQLEELELTGQTGELKLDAVATMSVKELRASVRKLQEDIKAKQARQDRDSARIHHLEDEISHLTVSKKPPVAPTPALEEADRLRALGDHAVKLVGEVEAGLRSHFSRLEKFFGDRGEAIPNHVRLAKQQAVTQVIQAARVLAGDFGITLAADSESPQELAWLYKQGLMESVPANPDWAEDLGGEPAGLEGEEA